MKGDVDAIAYSANNQLCFGGAFAKGLLKRAGSGLATDAQAIISQQKKGLPVGTVVTTPAHGLVRQGIRHILHAATLYWNPVTRDYLRHSAEDYLRDITNAVEETCRQAARLPDLKRLGLTLFGSRIQRKLYPDLGLGQIIAANVQGLHRFHLSLASGVDAAEYKSGFVTLIAARSDRTRAGNKRAVLLQQQLELLHPVIGDLLDCNAEALVVSANNWLFPGSAAARKVYERGGKQTQDAIRSQQPTTQPLLRGDTVTVPGGNLQDSLANRRLLIHAVTTCYQRRLKSGVRERVPASPKDVYVATRNALIEALRANVRSVGLTLMCTREGYHALPQSQAIIQMALASARAVNDLRTELVGKIDRVYFCLPTVDVYHQIASQIALNYGA